MVADKARKAVRERMTDDCRGLVRHFVDWQGMGFYGMGYNGSKPHRWRWMPSARMITGCPPRKMESVRSFAFISNYRPINVLAFFL